MTGGPLVAAVDQGTSSTRVVVYNAAGDTVASHQVETDSLHPHEGWVEQDPLHILETVHTCLDEVAKQLKAHATADLRDVRAIGITNQRESTIVWDRLTGQPLHNAIIWLDTRTAATVDRLVDETPTNDAYYWQRKCGLPISTYFSGVKLRWLLDNVAAVREEAAAGRCMFGTVDTWLLWNLTGGTQGGKHFTDVTNASRTMLMNITTRQWDDELCSFFHVPKGILPKICSSAEIYGYVTSGPFKNIPISACLGDQHAALVGQNCFQRGDAKNTYGTGCFMLCNVGEEPVFSRHGLLTTVGFQLGPQAPCSYALEGAVAIAGAGVRWLRDNLGVLSEASEVEALANQVDGTHGVYFVTAFSGLLAPYWRHDARGTIVGLTQYTTKAHIARATLEAVCFQTREVLEAMIKDSGFTLSALRVDGGMTANDLLLQLQADLLGCDVLRPTNAETTSWGAALAAALAPGVEVWPKSKAHQATSHTRVKPSVNDDERDQRYYFWKCAVERALGWPPSSTSSARHAHSTPAKDVPLKPVAFSLAVFLAGAVLVPALIARRWDSFQ